MATIQSVIIAKLTADATLMASLTGGVWNRKPKRNVSTSDVPTPGSTPGAFNEAGYLLPCAYVINPGEQEAPGGPLNGMWVFPQIWLRCLPRQGDKDKLDAAYQRIFDLLHMRNIAMPAGTGCELRVIGRLGQTDDEVEMKDTVVDWIRLQGSGLWR